MSLQVVVTIPGPADALAACRARLAMLLAEEFSGRYREHHVTDRLEYRITVASGVPFPPFVAASVEFPVLEFSFHWQGTAGEAGGTASIADGRLSGFDAGAIGASGPDPVHVEATPDGVIRIALAVRRDGDRVLGYAASDTAHHYLEWDGATLRCTHDVTDRWVRAYRLADGTRRDAPQAIDAPIAPATLTILESISMTFATAWLWFDAEPEVDTAVERQRHAALGRPVRPANLQGARLRGLVPGDDGMLRLSTLDADLLPIATLIAGGLQA